MRKLFFIAMIVLGTSLAQAQDDSIKRFKFKADASASSQNRNHLFSEDFAHCSGNLVDASTTEVFTWNSSTGALSLDGNQIGGAITGRRASGLTNLFAGTFNEVNTINSRGGFVSRLIYNEATNSWD